MMAAGLVVVAHNSGGPKEDIVKPIENGVTGFICVSLNEINSSPYSNINVYEI